MRTKRQHTGISGTAETVLRGKFTALNAHIRKLERSQIDTLIIIKKAREARENSYKS